MNQEVIIFHRLPIETKYDSLLKIEFQAIKSSFHVSKSYFKSETSSEIDPGESISLTAPYLEETQRWQDSFASIKTYFNSFKLNTNKDLIIPYSINFTNFIFIYYLAKTLNLSKLCKYLESFLYSKDVTQSQLSTLYLDMKTKYLQISFSELICQLQMQLSLLPPEDVYLTSIHFEPIIFSFLYNGEYLDFDRQWFLSVFNEFHKTREYFNEINVSLCHFPTENPQDCFVIWLYSEIFPKLCGNEKFLACIDSFHYLEQYENLNLSKSQYIWLFDNFPKKKELTNHFFPIICGYICSMPQNFELFIQFMENANLALLTFDQLIGILSIASKSPENLTSKFEQFYDQISSQIGTFISSQHFIFKKDQKMLTLTFNQLFSTFQNIPINDLIELLYDWFIHNQLFDSHNLDIFFEVISKTYVDISKIYLVFRIFNLLIEKNQFDLINRKEFELTFKNQLYELFNYIIRQKKYFVLHHQTITAIRSKFIFTKSEIIKLTELIRYLQVFDIEINDLKPIYFESLDDIFYIITNMKNTTKREQLIKDIKPICQKHFNQISITNLLTLITLIPFNEFFSSQSVNQYQNDEVFKNDLNTSKDSMNCFIRFCDFENGIQLEDRIVMYASLSNEFDPDLIDFQHISFRLLDILCSLNQKFQFSISSDSPIFLTNRSNILSKISISELLRKFMVFSIPKHIQSNSQSITILYASPKNEKISELFQQVFNSYAIQTNVIFPGQNEIEISNDIPIIIIKPRINGVDCDLHSIFPWISKNRKILVNMNGYLDLLQNANFQRKYQNWFSFDSEEPFCIEWSEPVGTFLPLKDCLPCIDVHNDHFYNSLACHLVKLNVENISFKNGRLFACKGLDNVSFFNYDIVVKDNLEEIIDYACLKQMVLTTISIAFDL